jgi:hypothetical protein
MAPVEEEVAGPLVAWKPRVSTDMGRVKLERFPETLYPEVHLDTISNSEETWGDPRRQYPHIESVLLKSSSNYGASGNCYFNASKELTLITSV